MKPIVIFALFLFSLQLQAQENFDKIRAEYEKELNNPQSFYGHNKNAGRFYNIRGIRMYAEIYGKGEPLLLIHGNGGNINNFMYQLPVLSKKYRIIVADSRSQGQSADAGDSLTYEMMADDYAALLDSLHIDSAYVAGWSDGGINGLLLAIRHPQKVKKLAVTGANLRPDTSAVFQEIWDMLTPVVKDVSSKPNPTPKEKNELKLVKLMQEQPHISHAGLQKISCPVLVIGGDYDVIKPGHTLEIFENIRNAYLWILPNSGHSTPVVYANEFNRKIDAFFKKPFRKFTAVGRFF